MLILECNTSASGQQVVNPTRLLRMQRKSETYLAKLAAGILLHKGSVYSIFGKGSND